MCVLVSQLQNLLRPFETFAASKLTLLLTNNEPLKFRVSYLTATVDDMHLQLATAPAFISTVASVLLPGDPDQYLALLPSSASQSDHLGSAHPTLLASTQDSRTAHCRGVDSLFEEFHASCDNGDIRDDVPMVCQLSDFL